eukprot:5207493-Pyramimonas_sp.AAC.1
MTRYMYVVSLSFSSLALVLAVDGRVVPAVHGWPGAAAIAFAAAARLYCQSFGNRPIGPRFILPRLDPVIINPASTGARRGWAGGRRSIGGGPIRLPSFPVPRSRFWAGASLSSLPRSGGAAL